MIHPHLQMNCPACYATAESERIVGSQAYCNCGLSWNINGKKNSSELESKKGVRTMTIFSLILISAVMHYLSWDTYSLQIIPLKAKQLIGKADRTELKEIATICKERKKESCQINTLLSLYEVDKSEISTLATVGEIYMKNRNFYAASNIYNKYFQNGGRDNVARESYAKALTSLGDLKAAQAQYEQILLIKDGTPNYPAARSYVEILMQREHYPLAKKIIEEYRKAGPTSALFLEKEWKTLNNLNNKTLLTQNRLPAGQNSTKTQTR